MAGPRQNEIPGTFSTLSTPDGRLSTCVLGTEEPSTMMQGEPGDDPGVPSAGFIHSIRLSDCGVSTLMVNSREIIVGSLIGAAVGIASLAVARVSSWLGVVFAAIAFGIVAVRYRFVLPSVLVVFYYPYFWFVSYLHVEDTTLYTVAFMLYVSLLQAVALVKEARRGVIRDSASTCLVLLAVLIGVSWLLTWGWKGEVKYIEPLGWTVPLMVLPFLLSRSLRSREVTRFLITTWLLSMVFTLHSIWMLLRGEGFATSGRFTGLAVFNPISAGHVMAFSAILSWSLFMSSRKRSLTIAALLAYYTLCVMFLVFLTGSRQALFLLLGASLVALVTTVHERGKKKIGVLVGACLMCVTLIIVVTSGGLVERLPWTGYRVSVERFTQSEALARGVSSRTSLWAGALEVWASSPVFGGGFGSVSEKTIWSSAHNIFLQALGELGPAGLLLLLGAVTPGIFRSLKYLRGDANWIKKGASLLFLYSLGASLVSGRLTGVVNLYVSLGVVLAAPEPKELPADLLLERHESK